MSQFIKFVLFNASLSEISKGTSSWNVVQGTPVEGSRDRVKLFFHQSLSGKRTEKAIVEKPFAQGSTVSLTVCVGVKPGSKSESKDGVVVKEGSFPKLDLSIVALEVKEKGLGEESKFVFQPRGEKAGEPVSAASKPAAEQKHEVRLLG